MAEVMCRLDENSTYVRVARLGDPPSESPLRAAVFRRHQPQISHQLPRRMKPLPPMQLRQDRHSGKDADPAMATQNPDSCPVRLGPRKRLDLSFQTLQPLFLLPDRQPVVLKNRLVASVLPAQSLQPPPVLQCPGASLPIDVPSAQQHLDQPMSAPTQVLQPIRPTAH